LGARLVVLGLLADALEDVAAGVVVEPATVEPARLVGEAAHDRLREAVRRLLEPVDLELEIPVALAAEAGGGVRPRHSMGASRVARPGQSPWGARLDRRPRVACPPHGAFPPLRHPDRTAARRVADAARSLAQGRGLGLRLALELRSLL